MKDISFPIGVYIMVKILDTNLYTCALVDTGSEISIFKKILINSWQKTRLIIKGVTGNKENIENYTDNIEIIIGNKIVRIKRVYQYDKIE